MKFITNQCCEEFYRLSIWGVYKSRRIEEFYPSEDLPLSLEMWLTYLIESQVYIVCYNLAREIISIQSDQNLGPSYSVC